MSEGRDVIEDHQMKDDAMCEVVWVGMDQKAYSWEVKVC